VNADDINYNEKTQSERNYEKVGYMDQRKILTTTKKINENFSTYRTFEYV